MSDVVYTVSQVNKYINKVFENEYLLKSISISGEVTNASMSGGVMYFNIKDDESMLPCVCFDRSCLEIVKNGTQVLILGSVNYYTKGGKLTFIVKTITPFGEGLLYKKYLELKDKLSKEGLFDENHKRKIPKYIKRIGVISSDTGAVIKDIINVTKRRNDYIDIILYPVKVQGVGAGEQIVQGIEFFSNYSNVDVIIVARGGGSFEDLMPFNSEIVARSVYNCKKPLVSAVGHETDFTIIDFVSDLRASTPSVAAELCSFDKAGEIQKNIDIIQNLYANLNNKVVEKSKNVKQSVVRISNIVQNKFTFYNQHYKLILKNAFNSLSNFYKATTERLSLTQKLLLSLNPENVIKRGYAKITFNNKILEDINNVQCKDIINIKLKNGEIIGEIKEVKKYDI